MTVSLYSFVTANLWFSALILLGALLQNRTGLLFCYRLLPLLFFLLLAVIRLVFPIDTRRTYVIRSSVLYPAVQDFLRAPLMDTSILVSYVVLGVWLVAAVVLWVRYCVLLKREYAFLGTVDAAHCETAQKILGKLLAKETHRRHVRLIVSPRFNTPRLAGLRRPTILLPWDCANLPEVQLEHILSHELTHMRNGDLWVKLLVEFLCCVLWWNPSIYIFQSQLYAALEYKCDLDTTKDMIYEEKRAYLETILALAKKVKKSEARKLMHRTGFLGIPENIVMKRRFALVLELDEPQRRPPRAVYIIVILALYFASYTVILQPVTQVPTEDVVGEVLFTPDNAFILKMSDKTYYLVHEGLKLAVLLPDQLKAPPFCYLPIQNEAKEN